MVDHLESFQHHCEIYYQKSLSFSEHKDSYVESEDENIEESKVVLDTFEHQIRYAQLTALGANSPSSLPLSSLEEELTIEQKEFLISARFRKHSNILKKCGLFIEYNDDLTKINYLPQNILAEYTRIKNEERHIAHETKMKERSDIFYRYLQEMIQNEKIKADSQFIGEYDVTTQSYLSHVRTCIRRFVSQYHQNLGSHSLLAGIRKLLEMQIEMNEVICLWKFNSTVISESSLFLLSNNESGQSSYMVDSMQLLSSFLTFCGDKRDVESNTNDKESEDSFVMFYIHPFISNSFLTQMLHDLPLHLDARPTGTFTKTIDINGEEKSSVLVRSNHVGQLDESYLVKFLQWSNSFCQIS